MQLQTRYYTPEEYLELEDAADSKHEYRDGEIVPMTGRTTNHNEIAGNFYAYLLFGLNRRNYKIYIADVRLWIPRYRLYTYPDVMLVPGKPIYAGSNKTTITNPMLIAEVLSPSTQDYDQGDKFTFYRSIPDLQEYLIFDQTQGRVMQHTKTDEGKWLLTEQQGDAAILQLGCVELAMSFADLYGGIDFTDVEEPTC